MARMNGLEKMSYAELSDMERQIERMKIENRTPSGKRCATR